MKDILIVITIAIFSVVFSNGLFAFSFFRDSVPVQNNPRIVHLVMDYNTGNIISEHKAEERRHPASLTKLMTLYILFDKLSDGEVTFTTKFRISPTAAAQVPTKLGLPSGSFITVQDAILAIIIKSANDISYAVAENISDSEANYVKLMNAKAKELGLQNTNFINSNGLHHNNQYTTALDMAKLSRSLMINHNAYYSLFSAPSFTWNQSNYRNHNTLLDYNGVDGIKTGYTVASGYNLVSSASKDNTRIIAVAMGFNTSQSRNDYMKEIVDDAFYHASNIRKFLVSFKAKPDNLNIKDSMIIDHKYSSDIATVDVDTPNSILVKKYVVGFDQDTMSENPYTIEQIPYVQKVERARIISISPDVKYVLNKRAVSNGRYKIQVGAFSNYKSALNTSYNIVATKTISKIANKKNIEIVNKSNLYMARITKLSKQQAYGACKILQDKGQDCFVISG